MRWVFLVLAVFASACADKTALLVEITSTDVTVPTDVNQLRVIATSDSGQMLDRTFPLLRMWPHSLTILPGNDRSASVEITVMAQLDGGPRLRRVVSSAFMPGLTRHVPVVLGHDCLDVRCDDGVDCQGGHCVMAMLDGGPPLPDAGHDAGRDAGPVDSGPPIDSGPIDAGHDAGNDAGPGPIDAGPMIDGGRIVRCSDATCAGLLVISEFSTRGPSTTAGANDEFVEIYNRGAMPLDVGALDLFYISSTGVAGRRATVAAGTIIPPGGYLLLASVDFTGPIPDVADRWSTGMADNGGTIELRAGGATVDRAAWGSATVFDTAAIMPVLSSAALTAGASYERKAQLSSTSATMAVGGSDELAGNAFDAGDNSMEFVTRTTRQPQRLADPTEP